MIEDKELGVKVAENTDEKFFTEMKEVMNGVKTDIAIIKEKILK